MAGSPYGYIMQTINLYLRIRYGIWMDLMIIDHFPLLPDSPGVSRLTDDKYNELFLPESPFLVCSAAIFHTIFYKKICLNKSMDILYDLKKAGFETDDIYHAYKSYIRTHHELRSYLKNSDNHFTPNDYLDLPKIIPNELNTLLQNAVTATHDLQTALLESGFSFELLQKCYIKNIYGSFFSHNDITGYSMHILEQYGVENIPYAIDMYKAVKLLKDVVVKNLRPDIDISGLNNIDEVLKTDSNNIEYVGNEEIETINNDIKDSIEVVDSSTLFDSEIKDIIIKSAIEPDDPFFEMLAIMSIHMIVLYIACNLFVSYWPIVKNYLINYLTGTKLYKRIFKKKRKK